jgi:leader peptidase (prepilin peptidase) / N-methyltransferase
LGSLAVLLGALTGLAFGSFASVPVYRWPRRQTIVEPRRSACPLCGTPLTSRDNVPILSWALLKGRCRHCRTAISSRYPALEGVTALLFAGISWVWWEQPLLLVAYLAFGWSMVVATAIDLEHRIIPNRLTYRLPFVLLPLFVAHTLVVGEWVDLRRSLLTACLLPLGMFLLSEGFRLLRGQTGMGLGDVKLAVSLGLAVGYLGGLQLVAFAYATIISAVVVALILLLLGKAQLASRIPFGPYLAVGAMLTVLFPAGSAQVVRNVLGL